MGDTQVLSDEDIKTTWQRGASTGPQLQADPDTTDGDGTDGTDGDSGSSDSDGTDSDSDSQDS